MRGISIHNKNKKKSIQGIWKVVLVRSDPEILS